MQPLGASTCPPQTSWLMYSFKTKSMRSRRMVLYVAQALVEEEELEEEELEEEELEDVEEVVGNVAGKPCRATAAMDAWHWGRTMGGKLTVWRCGVGSGSGPSRSDSCWESSCCWVRGCMFSSSSFSSSSSMGMGEWWLGPGLGSFVVVGTVVLGEECWAEGGGTSRCGGALGKGVVCRSMGWRMGCCTSLSSMSMSSTALLAGGSDCCRRDMWFDPFRGVGVFFVVVL